MILPPVHGKSSHSSAFIYTACDADYFDQFGAVLINSVRANTSMGLHVHLFNARQDQIDFCTQRDITTTHESIAAESFDSVAARWATEPRVPVELDRYRRTQTAMTKGRDSSVQQRMQKTYYACARFIRLFELFDATVPVFAMDVDAVVRSSPVPLSADHDFYIHKITGRKARVLAGGIYLNPTPAAQRFIGDYASALKQEIANDYLYWGLDQDLLDSIVPRYNHAQLPISYIDWHMGINSAVWTAKGTRKESLEFVNESARYRLV
jgi:hypothetical protein